MRLVVEFEGIVSVGEVLFGLCLALRVSLNPVEKFGVVAGVFGISRLIRLESLVVALFFFKGGFVAPAVAFNTAPPTMIAMLAMILYIRGFFSNH